MVKTVNIDLSKTKIDLTKSKYDLSKPSNLELITKATLSDLSKKAPKKTKNPFDIDFVDAVDGMVKVPFLPDFYYTPDEVVDPEDCGKYPESPFCGGSPFSKLPVGIEPQIVIDACNIGIGIQPVLFFIKLPTHQIVYRYRDCDPKNPPPVTTLGTPTSAFLPPPPAGCSYEIWWAYTAIYNNTSSTSSTAISYGGDHINLKNPPSYGDMFATNNGNVVLNQASRLRPVINSAFAFYPDGVTPYDGVFPEGTGSLIQAFDGYRTSNTVYGSYDPEQNVYDDFLSETGTSVHLLRGSSPGGEVPPICWYYGAGNPGTLSVPYAYVCHTLVCDIPAKEDPTYFSPPPPLDILPSSFPPPNDMDCCALTTALLKQLIVKVNKLSEAVGTTEYPAKMPASLISKDEGFFGKLFPDEPATIPNLTRLVTQFIKYFDEVLGEWEIPIQIKDADPTTPGDQPAGIRLPNLAEAQAEQFAMTFQSTVNIDLLINIATRTLAEVGQIKQQGFKNYGLTQTLVDYFNYEYGEEAKDMPLSFAPGKEAFDELLKETVQKVSYPEYTDKDNFKVALTRLLESAAIIKALNWRKVDPGGDIKSQIINTVLARAKQLDDEVKRQQDDLDKFVGEAEKGYPNLPGMPNSGEPYGEPYANRPIVKRVEE